MSHAPARLSHRERVKESIVRAATSVQQVGCTDGSIVAVSAAGAGVRLSVSGAGPEPAVELSGPAAATLIGHLAAALSDMAGARPEPEPGTATGPPAPQAPPPSPVPAPADQPRGEKVADLIEAGLLAPGASLVMTYRGKYHFAAVSEDGGFRVGEAEFGSPSGAAGHVTGIEPWTGAAGNPKPSSLINGGDRGWSQCGSAVDRNDRACQCRHGRKPPVRGQQGPVQRLGQRHVAGVVGRDVVPKGPYTINQAVHRKPPDRRGAPPSHGPMSGHFVQGASCRQPAQRVHDFGVDEVRRGGAFNRQPLSRFAVVDQGLDRGRGIDHDHLVERPSSSAASISEVGAGMFGRSSNSSGTSTQRVASSSSLIAAAETDTRSRAASVFSLRTTSSGTLRR